MAGILVTGVSGFVGKHLARELKNSGIEVSGVGLHPEPDPSVKDLLDAYTACDLTDAVQVSKIPLDNITGVINLAGLAQVGASFGNADKYLSVNVSVLSVLAGRILSEKRPIRVLAISTGAVYDSSQPMPLKEDSAITAGGSPYAQSKILMERKASELQARGLDCIVVRPFNHIGPGQEPGFLVPDLYQKIQSSLASKQPLLVGNLKTKRDYTDVRDVVKAYAALAAAPNLSHSLYNACSGRSVGGEAILEMLLKACQAEGNVKTEVDDSLIRPDDPMDIYGSAERLEADTGWRPQIEIEQTILDFVESKKA